MTSKLQKVNIGFVPLVDCALLAMARETGVARQYGLDLVLHKEVSWANIRDKVYLGYLDGAHMLSPMALAANLGLMPNSCDILAPFVLGRNGNAITVSHDLFHNMSSHCSDLLETGDLSQTAQALKQVIDDRKRAGLPVLRFAMVFPYSCHNYHLRYWLADNDIDPDVDVHLQVVPPPFMDQFLAQGRLDGFCVGEPWNSLAVAQDTGVIVATTSQIRPHSPEKLLGMRKAWCESNPDALRALLKALQETTQLLQEEVALKDLAGLLASHDYLDVPREIILRALSGHLHLKKDGPVRKVPDFLSLSGDCRPDMQTALWLREQMARWHQLNSEETSVPALQDAFAAEVYRDFLG